MANLIRGLSENGGVVFCGVDSTELVRRAEHIFLIVPKKIAKLSSVNSKFVTTKLESCRILLQKGHEKIYSDICFIEIDY